MSVCFRTGAVLKLGVWDWDRSSPDDPLGHFEVNIGEELLAQEVSRIKKDVYIFLTKRTLFVTMFVSVL